MKPVNCFICQTKSFFYQQNLRNIKTKHSKRPVTEFIEKLASNIPSSHSIGVKMRSDDTCVCYECLDKIDVYDLAKSTVNKLEIEFERYLSNENSLKNNPVKNNTVTKDESPYSRQLDSDRQSNKSQTDANEISAEDDSFNGFNFNEDDQNEETSDENENADVDVKMYITDCKVNLIFNIDILLNSNI